MITQKQAKEALKFAGIRVTKTSKLDKDFVLYTNYYRLFIYRRGYQRQHIVVKPRHLNVKLACFEGQHRLWAAIQMIVRLMDKDDHTKTS